MSMNISKQSDKVYIIIHGYFGFGNVGDEAILSVIIDEFKKLFKNVEFVVLSSNPHRTMRIHSVKAIREINFSRFLETFSQVSYIGFCRRW